MAEEIEEAGKLWLGAITVAAWIVFVGGYVLVDEMNRDEERLRRATELALDKDYLLPFRGR